MNINKNNYEAFFLDYHEGNLSPQQVAELLLFIEQHPELKEAFESFENLTLDDLSTVYFDDKSSLKKEITFENKEEYFIRSVESTLTPAEKELLENFIKQHPQFLPEFELFQKTKLSADDSIVFEGKHELKRDLIPTLSKGKGADPDYLLISSVEGLLTKQETVFLNQQLAVDAEMQNSFSLYKQTKLVADTTIVFENKEALKKKDRKIIPLYYYVAAAASIVLLIGLFFFFSRNDKNEPQFAKEDTTSVQKDPVVQNKDLSVQLSDLSASVVKKNHTAKKKETFVKKDSLPIAPVKNNEQPIINIAENKPENKQEPELNKEQPVANNNQQPITSNEQPAIASIQNKTDSKRSAEEFLSLRELAAEKIKEKILDENTLAVQKENGRSKRFSGWDFAQIVTRGISKATGRDVEVKPKYNEQGDVTAYALGDNLQIARK